MLRILSFVVAVFFVCCGQVWAADSACVLNAHNSEATQSFMPFPAALKHGINVSQWWDDTQNYPLSVNDIQTIHTMGFDFVRLQLSPAWLEMQNGDDQTKKLGQLRCDIISLLNEGMTVVIDMRPSPTYEAALFQHQEEIIPRIQKLWNRMQPVLADLPSWRIYLEIIDEPMIETVSWWRMQEKIIDSLRPNFPGNTLIASPGPSDGWWNLVDRTPYRDPNVVYDFHFYEPTVFTHRGIGRLPNSQDKPPSPIIYPVDKNFSFDMADPEIQKYVGQGWNRTALSVILKDVAAWRDHHDVVVVCLEFGVYRPYIDDKSRYNWLKDTHESLDNLNIPSALWDYRGMYGLFDPQGVADKGMLNALGLQRMPVP